MFLSNHLKLTLHKEYGMYRYYYELGSALALYTVVLIASLVLLLNLEQADLYVRILISLAPIISAALMCWAIVRQMRRLDEMHLRIQFEALGFAFASSALLTFSYGFLEDVGFPHITWHWAWPVMGMMWVIGLQVARRRYREKQTQGITGCAELVSR
jgi:hypothetical protein